MTKTVESLLKEKSNWTKDDFIFFWGHHKTKGINRGCFSQWWPCTFKVYGEEFNCAEQYMMAMKARQFGDIETSDKIMEAKEPNMCKFLGRQVKNFDQETWNKICYRIVLDGNFAKFSQNEDLKKELLATDTKILVEASPYDHIWGIKMSTDHPDYANPSKWQGTNLLGFALTEVRDMLKCDKVDTKENLISFTYEGKERYGCVISSSETSSDWDYMRHTKARVYSPPYYFDVSTTINRGGDYYEHVRLIDSNN